VIVIDTGLQGRLVALVQSSRGLLLDLGGSASTPPPGVRPGDALVVRVLSLLPDGRALIEMAGSRLPVRVPEGVSVTPGQQFRLAVLDTDPALRLQLPEAEAGARQAVPAAASAVSLSPMAERIAAVLQASRETDSAPAPLPNAGPVVARPETRGEALAAPLRQALETSGLFYESHQADWVAGRRALPELRLEPQARPAPAQAEATEAPTGTSSASAGGPAASVAAARSDLLQSLPPAVAAVLERQIEAVATQQILWTGELWPGQRLEWRVEERSAGGAAEDAGAAPWRTRLRLELPGLGAVETRLELAGSGLRLSVAAGPGGASHELRDAERDLRSALEARGMTLQGFRVEGADGS
jgi:hypothetical protein